MYRYGKKAKLPRTIVGVMLYCTVLYQNRKERIGVTSLTCAS